MTEHTENLREGNALRRGWTTGACATAATKAALTALLTGHFPDPVSIALPKGQKPAFPLAYEKLEDGAATVGIIKDAGDDPDVTHGAMIKACVSFGTQGQGVRFFAGTGVGTATLPGLPIEVGEPAINPMPRQMMRQVVEELCEAHQIAADFDICISVPTGEKLAQKTWNPRLGILGGISILGTTGIVVPFSCSAWIHSIHRGVDVARAEGAPLVAGCTGSTSEKYVQKRFGLPDYAMLDMGDFAGGLLKYIRKNPVDHLIIGGGFAKLCKLAQGHMDLHSGRSQIDFDWMAEQLDVLGARDTLTDYARNANSGLDILQKCSADGPDIAAHIAQLCHQRCIDMLKGAPVCVHIIAIGRKGQLLAEYGDGSEIFERSIPGSGE